MLKRNCYCFYPSGGRHHSWKDLLDTEEKRKVWWDFSTVFKDLQMGQRTWHWLSPALNSLDLLGLDTGITPDIAMSLPNSTIFLNVYKWSTRKCIRVPLPLIIQLFAGLYPSGCKHHSWRELYDRVKKKKIVRTCFNSKTKIQ